MFLWGQEDTKRCACVIQGFVQIHGVLPCLSYEILATPQGACSARKRPAKDGPGENRVTETPEEAYDQIFRTFFSGKTETRLRERSD